MSPRRNISNRKKKEKRKRFISSQFIQNNFLTEKDLFMFKNNGTKMRNCWQNHFEASKKKLNG